MCQQQTNPRDPGTHPSPITTVVDARPPLFSLGTFVCPRAFPVPLLKTKRGCSASASPPPQEHFFAVLRDSRQDERFFEAVTNFIRASVGRLADCRRRRLVLQRRADAAGRVRRSRAALFLSHPRVKLPCCVVFVVGVLMTFPWFVGVSLCAVDSSVCAVGALLLLLLWSAAGRLRFGACGSVSSFVSFGTLACC